MVRLSTSSGTSWSLISGTAGGNTVTSTANIVSTGSGCALYDPTASLFYSLTSLLTYVSTDAVTWTAGGAYNAVNGFSSPGCTISQNGTLFLIGGSQNQPSGVDYANDVWVSYDHAQTWSQATAFAAWSNRDSVSSWTYTSPYLNKSILTIFGGDALSGSVLDSGIILPDRLNNEVHQHALTTTLPLHHGCSLHCD